MNLKSLNRERILRQILPSIFFIVCVALYVGEVRGLAINLVAVAIALILLGNIFLQNKIVSQVFGTFFLVGSLYMSLALFSDISGGKATLQGGYWVGLVLVVISIAMSVLLIWGYERKKQFSEAERALS